jgi:4-hydroxy-tetrahydrodipicolinate synthase
VIEAAIKLGKGKVQVVAGTGSNNTADSVETTRWAKEAGADACLIVNPYYNKPTQAGLIAHVTAIAEVGLPIVLYNIPGRTGVAMTVATIAALAQLPAVQAIKDATGGIDTASELATVSDLPVLSGDDGLTLPFMSVGAKGVISVLSNLIPADVVNLVALALKGDYAAARAEHTRLFPLFKNMFIETNPVPVKRALELVGRCASGVRLPLTPLTADSEAKLLAVLKAAKVVPESTA